MASTPGSLFRTIIPCTMCALMMSTLTVIWPMERAGADTMLRIVSAARAQIGQTLYYDPRYRPLSYPNGDVPPDRGVCTDVVIRALRKAMHLDLQRVVHEDMRQHFGLYPQLWGSGQPDRNIDHRRVPNLQTFFARRGWALALPTVDSVFQPGDIVTCIVPPHRPHIMIVSDGRSPRGCPLVIHNIGTGTQEEDRLFEFRLTGHYRISSP
jgi:uncharacterized protein YijF (DUF1287 family)